MPKGAKVEPKPTKRAPKTNTENTTEKHTPKVRRLNTDLRPCWVELGSPPVTKLDVLCYHTSSSQRMLRFGAFRNLEGQARTEKRGKGAQARIPREGAQDDRKIVEPKETQASHQQTTSKTRTQKIRKPEANQQQSKSKHTPEMFPKSSLNPPKILPKSSLKPPKMETKRSTNDTKRSPKPGSR